MSATTLEPAGWLLLIASWAAVGSLVAFCVVRVLSARPPDDDGSNP